MFRPLVLTVLLGGLLCGPLAAQSREDKVRNDKKKVEAEGFWIYNDIPKAFNKGIFSL